MLLWIFRTIFVIIVLSVLFVSVSTQTITKGENSTSFWAVVCSGLGMAVFVFLLDLFTPKRKLSALAGVFFGLLVGLLISGALAPLVDMITDTYRLKLLAEAVTAIKWMLGICICFLTISVVIRTKDDVRFVVPYVEFAKQTKGARPLVLDTSVIVDGRVADLCRNKFFDAPVVIPRFVLNELQIIADSSDRLKRNRGRRGLDIIKEMQSNSAIDVEIDDTAVAESEDVRGVDQKIVAFTKTRNGRLATTDYNLTKVAQVREVDVININDLANSLKAIALPGEALDVRIIKPGEEAEQGVGYLPDGTMVVVDGGRDKIGKEVTVTITSSLQTSAGKMIFGKFEGYVQDRSNDRYRPSGKRIDTAGGLRNTQD
jgi:uncharacterized protein YacL